MPTLPPLSFSLALSAVMPLAPVMMNGLASPELEMERKVAPFELAMTTEASPTSITSMLPPRSASRPLEPPSKVVSVKFRPLLRSKPLSFAIQRGRSSGTGVESPIFTSVGAPAAEADGAEEAAALVDADGAEEAAALVDAGAALVAAAPVVGDAAAGAPPTGLAEPPQAAPNRPSHRARAGRPLDHRFTVSHRTACTNPQRNSCERGARSGE